MEERLWCQAGHLEGLGMIRWPHETLTYILYDKTAILYGLCCFDPPAPVGGQEGFNQG